MVPVQACPQRVAVGPPSPHRMAGIAIFRWPMAAGRRTMAACS